MNLLYLEMTHHNFLHQMVPLGLSKHGKVSKIMLQKETLNLEEMKLLLEKLRSQEEINI